MENNKENRAKFFAQYYGQKVLKHRDWEVCCCNNPSLEDWQANGMLLELKSFDSISDEDLNMIFNAEGEESIDLLVKFLMGGLGRYTPLYISATIDKVRAAGYAYPFMGLDVKTLVEYGWVKLMD